MDEKTNIPSHIAIIMDGNGRYAKKRFLPKKLGHKAGADTLKKILLYSEKLGVEYLTVYAFSTENWKRSDSEVNDLFDLLRSYLKMFQKETKYENVRFKVIGDVKRLALDIQETIKDLEETSCNRKGITLNLALNYGGRDEIVRATREIAKDYNDGKITEIDEQLFSQYLDTKECGDPELLIRTSNEFRLSNFLLWQIAYTEIVIVDKLWPEFKEKDLDDAIEVFNSRNRRYGGR